MAEVNGQIDSLSRLLEIFHDNAVTGFSTLREITELNGNYEVIIYQLTQKVKYDLMVEIDDLKKEIQINLEDYKNKIENQEILLKNEKIEIDKEIELYSEISSNFFKKIYFSFISKKLNKRKNILENHFEEEKARPFLSLDKYIKSLISKKDSYENDGEIEINKRVKDLSKRETIAKEIIEKNYSIFLGAIGEQKTVNELKKLPNSFTIINNFQLNFRRPLFDKNSGNYIYSVQADHIVIGPPGIFLIETKNWSKKSVENRDLYSPVEQVKRTNYALFRYLNNSIKNGSLTFFRNHWGDQKITVRNIIAMINIKPNKEFQYVKILKLSELLGYIKYFKPIFDQKQLEELKSFMIN